MRYIWVLTLLLFGCGEREYGTWVDSSDKRFEVQQELPIYNVNDAGVGDLNNDGQLDLWTTNHSSYQWLELQQGSSASMAEMGFSQDPSAPGLEFGYEDLPPTKALSIRAKRTAFVIEVAADSSYKPALVEVVIPWQTKVSIQGEVLTNRLVCTRPKNCLAEKYELMPGSAVELEPTPPPSDGFPIRLSFGENILLEDIGLGRVGRAPEAHSVELRLRDRHAFALADVVGGQEAEIFVSRGGARGRLLQVDENARDELFAWNGESYVDGIERSGIEKEGCPGRKAAWVDVDFDGDLDLYQVCGRSSGDQSEARNRLYLQIERGKFQESAEEFGLAMVGTGTFIFVTGVGQQSTFIWSDQQGIEALRYSPEDRRYQGVWSADVASGPDDKLTVGDIDVDGEPEVLRVSTEGNYWLDDVLGSPILHEIKHEDGAGSLDGNIVDIDADGLPEIFFVPQGVYDAVNDDWSQEINLEYSNRRPLREVRSNWVDLDGDGDLDLWMLAGGVFTAPRTARRVSDFLPEMLRPLFQGSVELAMGRLDWHGRQWHSVKVMSRSDTDKSILEIRVVGSPRNAQAVGAVVTVQRSDGSRQSSIVGVTDGSRYSQTHYLLYAGMNNAHPVSSVEVHFPDGELVRVANVNADEQLLIRHPMAR